MAKQPDPIPSLLTRLRKIEDWMRRKDSASPFFGTGVHPNGNQGLDSDNYVPATSGFSLNGGTGVAEFKDIILYDLPNSMLASPVVPGSVWETSSGFSVAVAWSNVVTKNVTVPAGYTRLEADAKARVTAFHNAAGAGIDYLYADLSVGGLSSGWYPLAVSDAGGSGTNHVFRNVLLTDLVPGSTVSFVLRASTSYNTWAGPYTYNEAQLGASLRWMR